MARYIPVPLPEIRSPGQIIAGGSSGSPAIVPTGAAGTFLRVGASGLLEWAAVSGGGTSATNLSMTRTAADVSVFSDTGTDVTIPAADATNAGVMSAADKAVLDGRNQKFQIGQAVGPGGVPSFDVTDPAAVTFEDAPFAVTRDAITRKIHFAPVFGTAAGTFAEGNHTHPASATNLTTSRTANDVSIFSDTGTDVTLAASDATSAGVMTSADRTKLDGVQAGAEVNVNADWAATTGDAAILNKPKIPTEYVINAAGITMTNMAAAAAEVSPSRRVWADLTGKTEVRTSAAVSTVGSAGSVVRVEYSTDNQATWLQFDPTGTTDNVPISTVGADKTAWITMPAGSRADVVLRLVAEGGDGVADPLIGVVSAQFR